MTQKAACLPRDSGDAKVRPQTPQRCICSCRDDEDDSRAVVAAVEEEEEEELERTISNAHTRISSRSFELLLEQVWGAVVEMVTEARM